MKVKILSLVLCCIMLFGTMVGCGAKKDESQTDEVGTNEVGTNTNANESSSGDQDKTSDVKGNKKVVFVRESDDDFRVAETKNALSVLEKNGYINGKNLEFTEISLQGDEKKAPEALDKVKQLKPDVVLVGNGNFIQGAFSKNMLGTGIPTVISTEAGNKAYGFADDQGNPTQNVTGLNTLPGDLQVNAFTLLQKIAPTNGKKAVFITTEGFFKKEDVEKNLKSAGVELKDYCESKYAEDWQAAVKKYNDDPDVAWELIGVWPTLKKDGSSMQMADMAKWDVANRKKPSVTYWEVAVSMGVLVGMGVDLPSLGLQTGEMALKILNGEDIKNIKIGDPRKINIVLNSKRAKDLNIQIPADILGSASKVYDSTLADTK